MTIELETTITQFHADGYIKPTAPYYKIKNTGVLPVILDNNFFLWPGTEFTVDLLNIAAEFLLKGILVENKTQFHTRLSAAGSNKVQISLIQTFIKIHP